MNIDHHSRGLWTVTRNYGYVLWWTLSKRNQIHNMGRKNIWNIAFCLNPFEQNELKTSVFLESSFKKFLLVISWNMCSKEWYSRRFWFLVKLSNKVKHFSLSILFFNHWVEEKCLSLLFFTPKFLCPNLRVGFCFNKIYCQKQN